MRVYATPDDLLAWEIDIADSKLEASLLRAASSLVREATTNDVYDTDPAGFPSEPEIITAFREAVCAQVEMWAVTKVNPLGGTLADAPIITSQSDDGASVSYAVNRTAEDVKRVAETLCRQAVEILRDVGLVCWRPHI